MLNRKSIVNRINKNSNMNIERRIGLKSAVSYAMMALAACIAVNPLLSGTLALGAAFFFLKGAYHGIRYSLLLDDSGKSNDDKPLAQGEQQKVYSLK